MTKDLVSSKFKTYLSLTKPGIIRGNIVVASTGFLLASKGNVHVGPLLGLIAGTSLVIASACVFNNYIDRGIDKKMARTKNRAMVQGRISPRNALVYASLLGIVGMSLLAGSTNALTVWIGIIGFIDYVVIYGIVKRRSVYGTLVGSVSGAVPPVAGYCAVTNRLDSAAGLLFLIMVFWQMAHFFAIAIYRFNDYKTASLPVLPVIKGIQVAKLQILFYIAAFTVAASQLYIMGYSSSGYFIIACGLGIFWFGMGIRGFKTNDDTKWARKMFLLSLVVISLLCATISADALFR